LIVGKGDAIFIDENAKLSIHNSAELSNSTIYYYKHSNASDLEACLSKVNQELSNNKKPIVVEGVYKTTGEISNLVDFINVSKKFGGIVLVNESHALGVLGKRGRGTLEYANIHDGVDIITGSLKYSLCSNGSYILLNNKLSKQFDDDSKILNDKISPLNAAISSITLDILRHDSKIIDKLKNNISWWKSHCKQNGIELIDSNSAITAIRIDDKDVLLNIQKRLYDEGLNKTIRIIKIHSFCFII